MTLSELIEKCPKIRESDGHTYTFNLSYMVKGYWFARYERFDYASWTVPDGTGKTPEEAVENLLTELKRWEEKWEKRKKWIQ